MAAFAARDNRLLIVEPPAEQDSGGTRITIFQIGPTANPARLVSLPGEGTITALVAGGGGRILARIGDAWQVWSADGEKLTADEAVAAVGQAPRATSASGQAAN
jgi:hypothetical protein